MVLPDVLMLRRRHLRIVRPDIFGTINGLIESIGQQ